MILVIIGTSGSGKSTLARKLMGYYPKHDQVFVEGRKRPLYEIHTPEVVGESPQLVSLGHYETPCGGADTLSSMSFDDVAKLASGLHVRGRYDVLMEGMVLGSCFRQIKAMHDEGLPVKVIAMDVDIDLCVASVNQRRRERNPDAEPLNPRNTINKKRTVARVAERLREAGLDVRIAYTRLEAEEHAEGILGL